MKIIWCILLFFPLIAIGQYDFDTRYFTIDAESLPDVPEINSIKLERKSVNTPNIQKFSDFNRVTSTNYWEAVDMAAALQQKESYKRSDVSVKALNQKYSVFGGGTEYEKDGSTKVNNTVYKEQRGLDLIDPCPPFGICPRCAPYRIGRGF